MRLEKLEINGFKSFRDKTILEFPDQFTAIVGPNGSGKSNIVDAICFVLGKSRGLRVSNLRELIHNGGKEGKESSFAKITLHLTDNGNDNKTRISREVNQEGQSIYKIDSKRVSRQEVVDLVGDNEYNIILQNDVTKIIEMQPKERRQIIDDICGIGEYDKKKAKALKELEKVENHISDTHLILGEKQAYLEKLGKERKDALTYKQLQEELKKCNASILHRNIESHEKKLENLAIRLEELEKEKENVKEGISEIKNDIAEKNQQLKETNSQILEFEKEKGLVRLPEIKGELVRIQDKTNTLNKTLDNNKRVLQEKKEKKNKLIAGINSVDSRIRAVSQKLGFLEEKIRDESSKIKGLEIEEEIDSLKTEVFDLRAKITAIREAEELSNQRIQELQDQKKSMHERVTQLKARDKELEKLVKERNKQHKDEFEEFAGLKKELPKIHERMQQIQKVLEGLRVEYAAKKAEIETVEKSSGGLKGTIRAINNLKEVVPGVCGPIFQLGKVLNHDYEEAMKVAAGGRMYDVVVEDEDSAIKCIKYLREKKIGRATFLPLSKIGYRKKDKPPKDSIGFARDFITTNSKYKPAFDYVFGNTVLVRDLGSAKKIGIGSWRMVTLNGDLLTESGAMTGGFTRKIEIGFSRADELEKEVKLLDQRIIELDGELQEMQLKREKLEGKLSKLETPVVSGRTDVEKILLEKESNTEKSEDLKYRIEEIDHLIKKIKDNRADEKTKVAGLEKDIKARERQLEALAKKRSLSNIEKLEKLKDEYRDLEVEQKTLEEKKGLTREQILELDEELKRLSVEKTEVETEIRELSSSRAEIEKDILSMEKENSELMRKIEALIEERGKVEEELTDFGSKTGEMESTYSDLSEEFNKQMIKKATTETKIEDLRLEFTPYEDVEVLDKGIRELESMVSDISSRLEDIGSVNLRSIETYDDVKAEFEETTEKLETLKNERQSIFDFMERVEQKKRETFNSAFDFVKESFESIYKELAGGEGTLILDNPREISDSGLIIKAAPKGKKLTNIDSLSGGEKVLTSSSFLLALQRYKPSYFYILDEMDAALDRNNSLHLAEMLRNSAAQFLLISHNDDVVKRAESVIGVSMNNGVSQIVGVKLT